MRFHNSAWSIAFASMLALSGCNTDNGGNDPLGSEVENEVVGATLFLANGDPAVNAAVRVYPVDHNPQSAAPKTSAAKALIFSTRTDSKGRYDIDSLPRGEYNILSELDGEVAYQDSVFIAGTKGNIASDTLRDPGSISGRVALQADADPRSVTIQLLGTGIFSNVDESGRFELGGLAQGVYRARLVTTYSGYTPLYADLAVRTGRQDTLPEPLTLIYTDIPLVENIRASLDTLNGSVKVEWSPVSYSRLREYVILASSAGSPFESPVVLGTSRDTFFTYAIGGNDLMWPGEFGGGIMEFRVAVRNKSLETGKTFESAEVPILPSSAVRTFISFEILGTHSGTASVGDTVTFIASFRNEHRKNLRLQWHIGGIEGPVRDIAIGPTAEGRDTFRFVWNEEGRYAIGFSAWDDGGSEWSENSNVTIVRDAPVPLKKRSGGGYVGDTLRIHATDRDGFGSIEKWEWDFGATGTFVQGSGPDTFVVVSDQARYPVLVRVTDDDGNAPMDTFWVYSSKTPEMVSLPSGTFLHPTGRVKGVEKFKIQATEVTRQQYQAIMGTAPSDYPESGDLPIAGLTIYEAMEYCNKLSLKEGKPPAYDLVSDGFMRKKPIKGGYRLPSLEEWEYAARSGNEAVYWEVLDAASLDSTTWYEGNSGSRVHPVASKKSNSFGLFDMNGNVSEMIDYYFSNSGTEWKYMYLMGSNFATPYFNDPGYHTQFRERLGYLGIRSDRVGFRIVLEE